MQMGGSHAIQPLCFHSCPFSRLPWCSLEPSLPQETFSSQYQGCSSQGSQKVLSRSTWRGSSAQQGGLAGEPWGPGVTLWSEADMR